MTNVSLYVELKAKPGKEEEVAAFLASAQSLVAAEPGTVAWFAARYDKDTFAIFASWRMPTNFSPQHLKSARRTYSRISFRREHRITRLLRSHRGPTLGRRDRFLGHAPSRPEALLRRWCADIPWVVYGTDGWRG
jgi:hypothetical protein